MTYVMRTTITLKPDELNQIKRYCAINDLKISALFRLGAKKIILSDSTSKLMCGGENEVKK
jgi:hypothetical protein